MTEQKPESRVNIEVIREERDEEERDGVGELDSAALKLTKSRSKLKKTGMLGGRKKTVLASQITSFLLKSDEKEAAEQESKQVRVWQMEDINFLNFQRFMKPVLIIPAALRTDNDIDLLEKCTSYLNFFEKVNMDDVDKKHNAHRRACQVLKYVEFKKGQAVFRFNDEPKDFFIVLKGEVGVFMPRNYTEQKREGVFVDKIITTLGMRDIPEDEITKYVKGRHLEKKEKEFFALVKYIQNGRVNFHPEYLVKKLGGMNKKEVESSLVFNENGTISFDLVCALKEGSMFGELALIYNQPRLATIISLTNSEMCTMDKKNFHKILGVLQRQENQKKIEFIQNEILRDSELASLAHVIGVNFVKRHVQRHKLLFQQGEVPEKVFLIYSGQVRLWKTVAIEEQQDAQSEKKQKAKEPFSLLRVLKKPKFIKKEFSLVGPGQMVGEEGLFSGSVRTYNATVDAETVLYEIDNERFLVACKNNMVVKNLMEKLIQKKIKHLQALENLADKLRFRLQQKEAARPDPILVGGSSGSQDFDQELTPVKSTLKTHRLTSVPLTSLEHSPTGSASARKPNEDSFEGHKFSKLNTDGSNSASRANLQPISVLDLSMKKDLISLIDRNCGDEREPLPELLQDLKQSSQRPFSPLYEFKLKKKLSKEAARMLYKPSANIDTKKIILESLKKPLDFYWLTQKRTEYSARDKDSEKETSPQSARPEYRVISDPHKFRIEAARAAHRRMNSHQLILESSRSQQEGPYHSVMGMSFSKNQSHQSLGGPLSGVNSLEVSKREIAIKLKRSDSIEDQILQSSPSQLFITQLNPPLPSIGCKNLLTDRRGGHSEISKVTTTAQSPGQLGTVNPPASSRHRLPSWSNKSYLPDPKSAVVEAPPNPDRPWKRKGQNENSPSRTPHQSLSSRKVSLPQKVSDFSVERLRQSRNNYLSMLQVQGLHDVLKMLPLQQPKVSRFDSGDQHLERPADSPPQRPAPYFRLKGAMSQENLQ